MAITKKVTSWSNSRLNDYEDCPAKFRYKHLDKIPEPKSQAMDRGIEIHGMAEQYLKGAVQEIPEGLSKFSTFFSQLREAYVEEPKAVLIEQSWCFTKNWEPCAWNDWDNCWLRIKTDCAMLEDDKVSVWDWKTGKFRPEKNADYARQLELYALGALTLFGDVTVVPSLVYLDTGDVYTGEKNYTAKDLPGLKKTWEGRAKPMFADTNFKPRPGNACRWCTYKAENGGPCRV